MRNRLARHSCVLSLTLCVILSVFASSNKAHAFAANRDIHHTEPGAKRTWVVTSLGDSIAAGFCGVGCLGMESYVHYFAYKNEGSIAKTLKVNIDSRGRAVSGYTSEEILDWMDQVSQPVDGGTNPGMDIPQDIRDADVITIDACGNDFLPARREFMKTCKEDKIHEALQTCKTNIDRIFRKAKSLAKSKVMIRVMNLYYPGIHKDQEGSCNGRTHYNAFLEYLVESNHATCEIARQHGIPCADAFSVMNASEEDRSKLAWIPGEPLEDYKRRVTVTYKHLISDPTQKRLQDGRVVNLMQDDNVHPTAEGHSRIAFAHQELGY